MYNRTFNYTVLSSVPKTNDTFKVECVLSVRTLLESPSQQAFLRITISSRRNDSNVQILKKVVEAFRRLIAFSVRY